MSEFTAITTQEELDRIIGERVKQAKRSTAKEYDGYLSPDDVAKKYEGYMSPDEVTEKYKGYLSPEEVAKKDATIKKYETASVRAKVAREAGLPYELADRLQGEDEEAMKKDAEVLAKFASSHKTPPLRSTESGDSDDANGNAVKKLFEQMKKENLWL